MDQGLMLQFAGLVAVAAVLYVIWVMVREAGHRRPPDSPAGPNWPAHPGGMPPA